MNRKPTLKGSKNCETETIRKNRLKKNLNWLNRTSGIKFNVEYF